ncbi:YybH family protein [Nocardia sp. NPDC051570]|uniref:YybH family protein n=1 Tax=Nocardia sp. NPDC051570 TaxID=3364324 RepID=UPI00379A1D50
MSSKFMIPRSRREAVTLTAAGALAAIGLTGRAAPASADPTPSVPQRFRAAVAAGDLDAMVALLADDAVAYLHPPLVLHGADQIRAYWAVLLATGTRPGYPGELDGWIADTADIDGARKPVQALIYRAEADGIPQYNVNLFILNPDGKVASFIVIGDAPPSSQGPVQPPA